MKSPLSEKIDWAKFLNKAQEIWGEQMKYRAFDKDGDELHENDVIVDFREESWKFVSILPDGKVYAQSMKNKGDRRIFFPSVFKITVVKEEKKEAE